MTENRKHLASVRVVQRNLVFVVGLSQRLADPEVSAVINATCHIGVLKMSIFYIIYIYCYI